MKLRGTLIGGIDVYYWLWVQQVDAQQFL